MSDRPDLHNGKKDNPNLVNLEKNVFHVVHCFRKPLLPSYGHERYYLVPSPFSVDQQHNQKDELINNIRSKTQQNQAPLSVA